MEALVRRTGELSRISGQRRRSNRKMYSQEALLAGHYHLPEYPMSHFQNQSLAQGQHQSHYPPQSQPQLSVSQARIERLLQHNRRNRAEGKEELSHAW
ncbi:unnamed protein product, partial [Discosporangium mesarthrocarpum]